MIAAPFVDTELLLAKTRLVFTVLENPSNLTMFVMAKMIRLAIRNRAVTWSDLKKRGVTPSRLRCLEERLERLPIATD